jgi:hypothetical protein
MCPLSKTPLASSSQCHTMVKRLGPTSTPTTFYLGGNSTTPSPPTNPTLARSPISFVSTIDFVNEHKHFKQPERVALCAPECIHQPSHVSLGPILYPHPHTSAPPPRSTEPKQYYDIVQRSHSNILQQPPHPTTPTTTVPHETSWPSDRLHHAALQPCDPSPADTFQHPPLPYQNPSQADLPSSSSCSTSTVGIAKRSRQHSASPVAKDFILHTYLLHSPSICRALHSILFLCFIACSNGGTQFALCCIIPVLYFTGVTGATTEVSVASSLHSAQHRYIPTCITMIVSIRHVKNTQLSTTPPHPCSIHNLNIIANCLC